MSYTDYCALTYDGQLVDDLLDGYMTINVSGRGLLRRNLNTVDVPGRDGTLVLSQKIPARDIRVYYLLEANDSKTFMSRLHQLHDYLKSDADVQFKFGDEDYHRFGRLAEAEDPPYDRHRGQGNFTLFCADPFKYKAMAALTGTTIVTPIISEYPFMIDAIEATFAADRTGFEVLNNTTGKKIVLTGSFSTSQVLRILPESGQILLNGLSITSRLDYVHSDWRGFTVRPGDQLIAPESMTLSLTERAL